MRGEKVVKSVVAEVGCFDPLPTHCFRVPRNLVRSQVSALTPWEVGTSAREDALLRRKCGPFPSWIFHPGKRWQLTVALGASSLRRLTRPDRYTNL